MPQLCSLVVSVLVSSLSYSAFASPSAWPSTELTDETATSQRWTIGQAVETTSGTLLGHASSIRPKVSEYLGIPYAIPPLGSLRFAAPKAYRSSRTFNASAYSPDCPSNSFNYTSFLSGLSPEQLAQFLSSLNLPVSLNLLTAYGQMGNKESEDCLTINVWTKPQTGEKRKAVMVWIYGGGFEDGSSDEPFYDGSSFAEDQDVVLVSFNYRTNVLGFPGLPSSSIPQNPGLMDQRLAIEWVRDNIKKFGGDPKRITIFGQSAGGASVDIYSYAWTKDPIVNAFIAESGTAISFFDPAPKNNSQAWFNASVTLGCGDASRGVEASIRCMRQVPIGALLNATAASGVLQSVLGNFGPTADSHIVFDDYIARGLSGDFIQQPLLIGNNDFEAGLFQFLASFVGDDFPDVAWCIFNSDIFSCPASKAASARALQGVPVWRYRYFGDFYNLRLTNHPDSGAWHGAEIPMLFKTAVKSSGAANSPAETQYMDYLQGAWAAFAKDPESGLLGADGSGYFFRPYDSFTPSLIQFAQSNTTFHPATYTFPSTYDAICPLLDVIDSLLPGGLVSAVTSGNFNVSTLTGLLGNGTTSFPPKPGFRCPF